AWSLVGSATANLSATLNTGMAVTSQDVNQLNTSIFESVAVSSTPPPTSQQVTVVQWNIHKGREECGTPHSGCVNSLDEITTYLVNANADVVSLNEVEYLSTTYQNEDEPNVIEGFLETKTHQCWQRRFTDPNGQVDGAAAHGVG